MARLQPRRRDGPHTPLGRNSPPEVVSGLLKRRVMGLPQAQPSHDLQEHGCGSIAHLFCEPPGDPRSPRVARERREGLDSRLGAWKAPEDQKPILHSRKRALAPPQEENVPDRTGR